MHGIRRLAAPTSIAVFLLAVIPSDAASPDEATTAGAWMPLGPAPISGGQVENVAPLNDAVGAIHTVVAHPSDPDVLWVGAVNGGVWRTRNATAVAPTWEPLTDRAVSLSIGALAMDPTDPDVLVAGIGRFSSYGRTGGPLAGLLHTTDGGDTWTTIAAPGVVGRDVSGVTVRGDVWLVATNGPFGAGGLVRSDDGGATWTEVSGAPGSGLPAQRLFDLVADPTDPARYWVTVVATGVFRSDDAGATWVEVGVGDPNGPGPRMREPGNSNAEMAVAPTTGRIYVAVVRAGRVGYIGYGDDRGDRWTRMDLPQTPEAFDRIEGLNPSAKPGGQGSIHLSIAADPRDPEIVYVGGDRQPGPFPNFLDATDYSGRLFRGHATNPATGEIPSPQWKHLTHHDLVAQIPGGGTASLSSPHADSRDMTFDANGDLIEVDDGGIYRRTSPQDNAGDWVSLNGNIQTTEFHDIAYDRVSGLVFGGAQDTGTPEQIIDDGPAEWRSAHNADGGDVEVDPNYYPGFSRRFSSYQYLAGFRWRFCRSGGQCLRETFIGLFPNAGSPFPFPWFSTPVEVHPFDSSRLVVGAYNGVFESYDVGQSVDKVPGPGVNGSVIGNPLVYGHRDNPSLIWSGWSDRVYVRTEPDGALVETRARFPGDLVRDIAVDPADPNAAVAVSAKGVYRTVDLGASWHDLGGNLFEGREREVRSVAWLESDGPDRIVVGTSGGVYVTLEGSEGVWFRLGANLPNAPAWDLDYDARDDVLVAGTLGRGAWRLDEAAVVNVPPVARCAAVERANDPGTCAIASASIDDGSFDPEGDPISLAQSPTGPYPVGATAVSLVVEDDRGGSGACGAAVTVADVEPPTIVCGADATMTPRDAPRSFAAAVSDNCAVAETVVEGIDCWAINGAGKRVDKTEACVVSVEGTTVTIHETCGVGCRIDWSVAARDANGNGAEVACGIDVVRPGERR